MNKTPHERRLIENEAIFRQANEDTQSKLQEIEVEEKAEGVIPKKPIKEIPLHFMCECSDLNCTERIIMTPDEYQEIHTNRKQFIILPGHEEDFIERIAEENQQYAVVEKFAVPPENPRSLKA